MARQASRGDARWLSLEATAVYEAAKANPYSFVRQDSGLAGIDEVQRGAELARAMKDAAEEDRRVGKAVKGAASGRVTG